MIMKLRAETWKPGFAVTLVALITLALRLLNAPQVWIAGALVPETPDPHFHIFLMERFLTGNGSLPLFSPLLDYPHGALLYWPPGFDMVLALIGWPVWAISGSLTEASLAAGLIIPLLGLLSVLFLWKTLRTIGLGSWTAFGITLLTAVSYSLVEATRFGRVDHQAPELAGWSILLWMLAQTVVNGSRSVRFHRAFGIFLGTTLFLWNGALLTISLTHLMLLVAVWTDPEHISLRNAWRRVAWWSLPTAVLSVAVTGTLWQYPFSPVYLSLFHLSLCLAAALVAEMAYRFPGILRRDRLPVIALVLAALVGLTLYLGRDLVGILIHGDLNAALVPESEGLFHAFGLSIVVHPLILLAVPVSIGLALPAADGRHRVTAMPVTVALAATFFLSCMQIRFVPLMEPLTAIGLGMLVMRFASTTIRTRLTTALVLLLVIVSGFFAGTSILKKNRTFPIMKALLPVMEWMRQNTEPAGSVLSPVWGYGHYVVRLAERPSVSCAFGGTPEFERGIRASLLSCFVPDEPRLLNLMADMDARYLLLPDMRGLRPEFAAAWNRAGHEPLPLKGPFELDRLYDWNNSATDKLLTGTSGSCAIRLIYNSPHMINGKTAFRVYERVPGATVSGSISTPKGAYLATVVLLPSNGKPVLWRCPLRPNPDGSFQVTCPYNSTQNGDLKALSPLEIWDLETRTVIQRCTIAENDIRTGAMLQTEAVVP